MQLQSQKPYQLFLTALGLCMFVAALVINHYHPHNQGIADITRGSLLKSIGISQASPAGGSGLSYVKLLPAPASTADTAKIEDPTTPTDNKDAQLPTVASAGEDSESADTASGNSTQDPAKKDKTSLNSQRQQL
jgi:hypothetical protein